MAREIARQRLSSGALFRALVSESKDGDFSPNGDLTLLSARQQLLVNGSWTWFRQVHGSRVLQVDQPGGDLGVEADAAVTATPDCVLSIVVADCIPAVLIAEGGAFAVIHAGWRGIMKGIFQKTLYSLTELSSGPYRAVLGPFIRSCCYEFGASDLVAISNRFGETVISETRFGSPALDLSAAAKISLNEVEVEVVDEIEICTCCDGGYWSYRENETTQRQVMAAWLETNEVI